MNEQILKRLDIGSGTNKIPGSTYLDVDPNVNPDILHDLDKFPYPVADDSYDQIYAKHIIERRFVQPILEFSRKNEIVVISIGASFTSIQ